MKFIFALIGVLFVSCGAADGSLVVATMDLNGKFSPFTGATAYDMAVSSLALGDGVIGSDRVGDLVYNGVAGEWRVYNGSSYFYDGIADVSVSLVDGCSVYNYKLRRGVRFSDGVEMDADDFIFSLYVFCDPSYSGSSSVSSLDIQGLADYRVGLVSYISGIRRVGDFEVDVVINGVNAAAVYRLAVQPAPLHYYGDVSLYDYDNHLFGFPFGDLGLIMAKDGSPMGAGPYRFVKMENKVVYFEANNFYWRGVPKIKNLQFKVTASNDDVTAVTTGAADISSPSNSKERLLEIAGFNSNNELSGDVITYDAVDALGYGYIGLNAKNVSVGGVPGSVESKNLRKGLAVVLSVYRGLSVDSFYGKTASVINYPVSSTSWVAPKQSDPDYRTAFSLDVNGGEIYSSSMGADERYAAARGAALGFFRAAGFSVAGDRVVAAPVGASLVYDVMIGAAEDHPVFMLLTSAKGAFSQIGITLNIQSVDWSVLANAMHASTTQIWVAAWGSSLDPDMYQVYHSDNVVGGQGGSSNIYMIADARLDEYIVEARTSLDNNYRRELFRSAFDVILDWGVEVPVYQRQDCTIFSTKRIKIVSLPRDMTTYWSWVMGVHNIEMN